MVAKTIRILIVDDEKGICFTLKEVFQAVGHLVDTASSGEEALEVLRETRFDAAVVDLNLGGKVDGMQVLRAIRWRWPDTAVVILTAHGSLDSAIAAIHEDVDDYLLKPAGPDQVRQAVQQALDERKKNRDTETAPVIRGSFCIDLDQHIATRGDQRLELTPQEIKLLAYLMQNEHRVVSPVELVRAIRGYEPESLDEARQIIKWYIHRLRQHIEPDSAAPRHIVNVRGVGYRFKA